MTDHVVRETAEELEVVVSGRAIAISSGSMASALTHPGVVAVPLVDGPPVETRLVWRTADENPMVHALVDLADAWIGGTA